ncbi:hypothetical protein [Nocardia gipuzkoensis]|uniref:hypothetical protein n=1 Tax=Nocardia gipuzkoensis TaxID=2749991 RepID=UPI0015EE915E|nr:hypothetical protein [Nocardia gipuzkoensis]
MTTGNHATSRVVRIVLVLLTALIAVTPLPAFAQQPVEYKLRDVSPGDEMHIPVLIWRHRHSHIDKTWLGNVAAFDFVHNGMQMIVVAPNLNREKSAPKTAAIDILRLDPATGELIVVDLNGVPLTVNGQPASDWRGSSRPSFVWDLAAEAEADADLRKEMKDGGLHSERIASLFLDRMMNGASATSRKGLSERIPCMSTGNNCRMNLAEGNWFAGLRDMRYLITKRNALDDQEAAALEAPAEFANTWLKGIQNAWDSAGRPIGPDARARIGPPVFVTPDSPIPNGVATSVLTPGSKPGGIDFSTVELRYLADRGDGQLQYSFNAMSATSPSDIVVGQIAAVQASDAFFVWLSLPASAFWVNLNPNEPDRIIDAKLGTTDVGRILLVADLEMKKVVGRLIHPDTDLGRQFWRGPGEHASCIDMRQWIVPAPATVYERDGGLHIVDAPLQVQMESDFMRKQGMPSNCTNPDAQMENMFRDQVLPKVQDAVNHAPEFTELRRVYLSRVAAEWYRERHRRDGALSTMIDSGDVSAWPALQPWSSHEVFDRYVHSYNNYEFNVTKEVPQGDLVYTMTYTYGGVDFSQVPLNKSSQHAQADVPGVVDRSFDQTATDQRGKVWFGSTSRPTIDTPDPGGPGSIGTLLWQATLTLLVGGLLIVFLRSVVRVRRRNAGWRPAVSTWQMATSHSEQSPSRSRPTWETPPSSAPSDQGKKSEPGPRTRSTWSQLPSSTPQNSDSSEKVPRSDRCTHLCGVRRLRR